MLKQLAKDFYSNLWHMPPNETALEEFAKLVLSQFIEELEENQITVVWNRGLDSVVFISRDVEKQSLQTIKERYFGNQDNKSNSDEPQGRRVEGHTSGDSPNDVEN